MLIEKIICRYRQDGFMRTLQWGGRRIMERIVFLRISYVMEKELSEKPPHFHAKIDVEYTMAGTGDFETLKEKMLPWKHYKAVYDDRIRREGTCIIGHVGSQAVGYIWLTSHQEKDRNLGFTIKPGDDEIYGFDLYVLPEYRKYLVGYELISLWLKKSYKEGKKRVIGVVEEWNKPMLITMRLVFGFRITKAMYSLELFKRRGILIYTSSLVGSA